MTSNNFNKLLIIIMSPPLSMTPHCLLRLVSPASRLRLQITDQRCRSFLLIIIATRDSCRCLSNLDREGMEKAGVGGQGPLWSQTENQAPNLTWTYLQERQKQQTVISVQWFYVSRKSTHALNDRGCFVQRVYFIWESRDQLISLLISPKNMYVIFTRK